MATIGVKTGKAKSDHIAKLLKQLRDDLGKKTLAPATRRTILEELKVYGRSVENSDPIFERNGIDTLGQQAFRNRLDEGKGLDLESSREALRCLANALLLQAKTRQMLVDFKFDIKAAEILKSATVDDEFLLSRILFLLTYGTSADFEDLIGQHALGKSIETLLDRHADRYRREKSITANKSPMPDMALTETSKLLFNITHFLPNQKTSFANSVLPLTSILLNTSIPYTFPHQPLGSIINTLLNLDTDTPSAKAVIFPASDPTVTTSKLTQILDKTLETCPPKDLETALLPLLNLIRNLHTLAPPPVKAQLSTALLPSNQDRALPLGKSTSTPSKLLKLSSNSTNPALRTTIQTLLFELCNEDADLFVKAVGFGYASGYLASRGMPFPSAVGGAGAGAGTSQADGAGDADDDINPVTGQRRREEEAARRASRKEPEEMTEEEKEREAERLFVLFERLRATGVVDVENPVRRAMQEGRFEEVDE